MKLWGGLLILLGQPSPAQDPPASAPATADRPNILFILTDDHRPDALGCYGNGAIRTPTFDAIAREGARFDAFYTASPECCPSRASFLTGRYPHEHGIVEDGPRDLPANLPTVATTLSKAGYATGFVGKAHLGGDPRKWGFADAPLVLAGASSRHKNPRLSVDGVEREVAGHITPLFIDAAIAWVEKRRGGRWFLWLAPTAPHTPYLMDPKHPYTSPDVDTPPLWPRHESLSDHDWAGYYSTISMLDAEVGRLVARLRELGLLDTTLLLVAGDNGFMQGSHGYPGKQVWFEESVRVPALARWPGKVAAGTRVSAPVVSVDLFPTLCEVAGVERPAGEAASFLPALLGKEPLRKNAHSEVRIRDEGHWQMVRGDRFKYVRFDNRREHLYDLWNDPSETRDLATGARHVDTLEEMRDSLRQWQEATK